ncbi:uncharacterized protein LOC129700943 isoform X4 [Leucoraja erinacea]|uniref:uncharacterized protein LOC129700943 isoform X4 n=1 Tax=Leucoraja erinaceus TaxID=7782 RepID=UPI002456A7FD|nr:uncharacterized protein LOC129700943 isoform X4 [Leucoraja erinacea]
MYAKEELAVRLDFEDKGAGKLTKNQTKIKNAVIRGKLGCDIIPCLNHGRCTFYRIGNLGFLCICPPGFDGEFCQYRAIEPFTVISLLGIIAIPVLIFALCFAICCMCNRERLHHQALKNGSEICLNPFQVPCDPNSLRSPLTGSYQERCEKNYGEPENSDFVLLPPVNDPGEYYPELNEIERSDNYQVNNVPEVEQLRYNDPEIAENESRGKHSSHSIIQVPSPENESRRKRSSQSINQVPSPAAEERNRKCSTHSQSSCTEAFQRCLKQNQQAKAVEADGRKSSFSVTSQSPRPAGFNRKFSTYSQSPCPAEEVSRKFSTHSLSSCAEAFQRCLEENQQAKAVEEDRRNSSFSVTSKSPCPEKQEEKATKECRRIANLICKRLCAVDRQNSFMENKYTETVKRRESSRNNNQEPYPVNGRRYNVKNEQTKAAEGSKRSTPSTRSQGACPVAIQCCIEISEQMRAAEKDRKKCTTKFKYLSPYPERRQMKEAHESRRKSSPGIYCLDPTPSNDVCLDPFPSKVACLDPCSSNIVCLDRCSSGALCLDPYPSHIVCLDPCSSNVVCLDPCSSDALCLDPCSTDVLCPDPCSTDVLCPDPCSSDALCPETCTAYEDKCQGRNWPDSFGDTESRTCTTESSDPILVEKCDVECQFSYRDSREPSEDCMPNNNVSCPDEVEQTIHFHCKNHEIMQCNNLSDNGSSSRSSSQEYLANLPTDISTSRSESSSQISSCLEVADDFGNKSDCSLNSSIPSEALLNLMHCYFAKGDDVKSVQFSFHLDKSQTDDLSQSTNVKGDNSRFSYQGNSPSTSEEKSKKGLKNKCCTTDYKSIFTDMESTLTSVENLARNCSSLDTPDVDSLVPTMVIDSNDWYCAEDKEPCSKTTVRYMFTDSETDD